MEFLQTLWLVWILVTIAIVASAVLLKPHVYKALCCGILLRIWVGCGAPLLLAASLVHLVVIAAGGY